MSTYDEREVTGGNVLGGWPKKVLGYIKEGEEILNEEGRKLRAEFEELFGKKAVKDADRLTVTAVPAARSTGVPAPAPAAPAAATATTAPTAPTPPAGPTAPAAAQGLAPPPAGSTLSDLMKVENT